MKKLRRIFLKNTIISFIGIKILNFGFINIDKKNKPLIKQKKYNNHVWYLSNTDK